MYIYQCIYLSSLYNKISSNRTSISLINEYHLSPALLNTNPQLSGIVGVEVEGELKAMQISQNRTMCSRVELAVLRLIINILKLSYFCCAVHSGFGSFALTFMKPTQ